MNKVDEALQRLMDRQSIYDVMCQYARAVDRGDWDLLRRTYHHDAYDDHVEYKGDVDGLVEWLTVRFADVDNSTHFLGNCLVEFLSRDVALVETYFVSRRLVVPSDARSPGLGPKDALCRQVWGRYLDRFERRRGNWLVASRQIAVEARDESVALGGVRGEGSNWGLRDKSDKVYELRSEALGEVGPAISD